MLILLLVVTTCNIVATISRNCTSCSGPFNSTPSAMPAGDYRKTCSGAGLALALLSTSSPSPYLPLMSCAAVVVDVLTAIHACA